MDYYGAAITVNHQRYLSVIMSHKRKIEEYHDPDYTQFQPKQSNTHPCCSTRGTDFDAITTASTSANASIVLENRETAIRRIIETEFQRELELKEREIEEIGKRLSEAKQLLARVRYTVVYNYYSKKSLICSTDECKSAENQVPEASTSAISASDLSTQTSDLPKNQMAIHPSLKKLLGKRPINYNEILKVRPTRKAAKNAIEQFHKLKKPISNDIKFMVKEEPSLDIDDSNDEERCEIEDVVSISKIENTQLCHSYVNRFRKNRVTLHHLIQAVRLSS